MDVGGALGRVEAARRAAAAREVHDARTASILGIALGVSFSVCFATGLWSHLNQQPPGWLTIPLGPASTYRITQGLHVITGLASIPLLLAKLFSVSPQLLRRPPVRDAVHAMERLGLLVLVGGSVFLLGSGAANIARWYPWKFFFPVGHYWAAWMVVGALLIHGALKAPVVRRNLGRARFGAGVAADSADSRGATDSTDSTAADADSAPGALTRRALLGTAGATAGLLTLLTAGQTVPLLRNLAFLAPRHPDIGSQGLPVNRTASAAGTTDLAGADYRLTVTGPGRTVELTMAELRSLPQRTETLPITCVEGWSADARWTGVAVADLLDHVGLAPGDVTVSSAQTRGGYRDSELSSVAIEDRRCLLALDINGEPLNADHGAPLRLIAPNRPGVMQTKWVTRVELQ